MNNKSRLELSAAQRTAVHMDSNISGRRVDAEPIIKVYSTSNGH